ncbi:glycosyltransferase [Sphingobium algorifonticola]|uniref:Glycosyltransferase n=1 Tax=Sphingobium algorifonticola TaxID=2008318 RepID=A0A437JAU6_9SPHN|nr:glycosyltransferase [Sphingobium algorifonticola]
MALAVMTLSVLTIVKNRSSHLAQLVEGLRRSHRPPSELVIVDMASTSPVDIAPAPFPTRIVRIDLPGLPLAAARNAAARAAHGEMLLFLDVDCIAMAALTGVMADNLACHDALICAEVLYLGPNDADGPWQESDLLERGARHPVRAFPRHGVRREDNAGLFWSLVFGIRRRRFFDLGGFDEQFTGYGAEDTDFGFRARAHDLPLLFMGEAGAFHQYHDSFDPPLQHFDDIVRNAGLFRNRWQFWPMDGWLAAFEDMGLIVRHDTAIEVLRSPSSAELALTGLSGRSEKLS